MDNAPLKNVRHEKFAQLVAAGMTQADAYREVYPRSRGWTAKTVREHGSKLAAIVAERVDELRRIAASEAVCTVREIQERLSRQFRALDEAGDVDGLVKVGALLTNVFQGNVNKDKDLRYISGNVLTGKQVSPNGYLGAFHNQLTVIPEGDEVHEFLGWIAPRCNQFSTSHSYFSWLMGKKEYVFDARVKGGERHMIMSNEYDKVFPMDIYPEYLVKAIIAGDIDRMEALGIYESLQLKRQVLLSATEAAEMIVRVDEVIKSAPRERMSDAGRH